MTNLKDIEQASYTAPVVVDDEMVEAALEAYQPFFSPNECQHDDMRRALTAVIPHLTAALSSAPSPEAVRSETLEEVAKIAFEVSADSHYYGEASVDTSHSIYQQGAYEVYEAIRALQSTQPELAVKGDEWQPIETAEERAFDVILRVPDGGRSKGYIEVIGHWACDLSGEEQPPFRGWFTHSGSGFREIFPTPTHWRKLLPAAPLNPIGGDA